nr:uncharacterized protein LOC109154451 [Ipomoea trifida]
MLRMMTDIKQEVSTVKHDMGHMRQEWKQEIIQEVSTVRQEISNYRQESTSSIHNLENQMAQVTKTITERARGALPSTTENNPRERVQAITLRSGKELPDPVLHKGSTSKSQIEEENVKIHVEENAEQNTGTVAPAGSHAEKALEKGKEKADVPVYRPPLPYPGRFSWGTTIACCEKNFKLVDNNLVGCVNDESLDVDEFDNVDSCVCDAISVVENDNACCDMNGEVEEEMLHAKLICSLLVLCLDFYVAHVTYRFVCRKTPRRKQLVKSPNKRPLKKQKQPGDGSSRGQDEPEAALRHVHLSENKKESFVNYQTKLIGVVLYFDDVVLSKYVPKGHFKSWTDKAIQFQAFGKQHQLSINYLAVHMGFYTRQETRAATFHELLDSYISFSVQEFWSEVTDSESPYQGSVSSHREFSEPEHMVVHHVMSHSFTGRMGAVTLVNTTDILCLYSMTKGLRIHMGWSLLNCSRRIPRPRSRVST